MNQSVTRKGIIFTYIKRLLFVFFSVIRMLLEEEETQIDRLVDNISRLDLTLTRALIGCWDLMNSRWRPV